jgi:hypothetical protein
LGDSFAASLDGIASHKIKIAGQAHAFSEFPGLFYAEVPQFHFFLVKIGYLDGLYIRGSMFFGRIVFLCHNIILFSASQNAGAQSGYQMPGLFQVTNL